MHEPFSRRLDKWLKDSSPKTLSSLIHTFSEKSFAILFLILLIIPALPLPTGGVTHIFEIIAGLLCLELIIGRRTVWLPKKWLARKLPVAMRRKTLPFLVRNLAKLEKFSRPRLTFLFDNSLSLRFLGLLILGLDIFAFLAPPFTGLDTLPALGVVLISLAMLLEDVIVLLAGLAVGGTGIVLVLVLGKAVVSLL